MLRWPWVSRALYRNVLRQLAAERRRAESALEDLRLERSENRAAERHFANMLLRKANSYPLPTKEERQRPPMATLTPPYDPGELVAVLEEARRLGVPDKDAKELFAREKGLDSKLIN